MGTTSLVHEAYLKLADVLRAQERFDEAGKVYLETWRLQRDELGGEDGDTLKSLTTLAHIRNEQGRFDEAIELCDRAMELGLWWRGRPAREMTANSGDPGLLQVAVLTAPGGAGTSSIPAPPG